MREYEFTITFEAGADRLMDVFVDSPGLRAGTAACFANDRSMWRIDRAVGPDAALEALETEFLDEETCNECLDHDRCSSDRRYTRIGRGSGYGLYYTRREEIASCHSIPYLAVELVGDGVLLSASRRGHEYRWRLLVPEECRVGELYDRLGADLRSGISIALARVTEATTWHEETGPVEPLPPAQREALETAIDAGYYETPRGTTVARLASKLGVPESTAQYRLQRAEATVLEQVVGADPPGTDAGPA